MNQQEQEHQLLKELTRSGKIEHRYQERLSIILHYEKTGSKRGVSRAMKIDIQKVRRWLSRWQAGELIREELYEEYNRSNLSHNNYKKELLELVGDKPRSGTPRVFTLAEKEQIVALGSSNPSDLGLPYTHWSLQLLRDEAIKRGVVKKISVRQVGRFLKGASPSTP